MMPLTLSTTNLETIVCKYLCYRCILSFFVFIMLYHGRQVKIAYSLDFLWNQQAEKELEGMREMHRHTNQLLQNILPIHVAEYFLKRDRQSNELYAQGEY